jgi:glycosyltransferase involved in cell wall biosynthesis
VSGGKRTSGAQCKNATFLLSGCMRVIHLSYACIMAFRDPEAWLKRIDFFVVLLNRMARQIEVKSIHFINYEGVLEKAGVEYHFLKRNWTYLLYPIGIHRYVKKLKPDIIVVHGFHFSWQVLWLRWHLGDDVKIVVQHHAERPFRHYKRVLQKLIDRHISAYFFTSRDQAVPWVMEQQIERIDKVVEIMEVPSVFESIERDVAIQRTGVKGTRNYLWVGRLDENKDPVTLVKAFIRFASVNQEVHLYMVFRGDELISQVKELLSESRDVANRVMLVGNVEHGELLYWFNSADFIISTSHYEGSGIAVCEAMSCGCIPILTNIPSFRMMTGNGNCGLLFTPGAADDLLQTLMKSTEMDVSAVRKKVLEQYRQHLSPEAISEKMIDVFREILKNKK